MDCNSFYASCEQVFRPDLSGKPVLSNNNNNNNNNDGCIIARSAEAKKLGIPMGEAFFKIKGFLKAKNVAVFSSNFSLYAICQHGSWRPWRKSALR